MPHAVDNPSRAANCAVAVATAETIYRTTGKASATEGFAESIFPRGCIGILDRLVELLMGCKTRRDGSGLSR